MKWLNKQKFMKRAGDITDPSRIILPEKKLNKEEIIAAIRQSIMAEQDAIILYESFANSTDNDKAKKIFLDIAEEEKVHVGEFQALLESFSETEEEKIDEGKDEAKEKMEE